ncbi:hydroxymethylglutaryl-CoA lyase [Anaerosphaera aminiphila DSM 21120]|uniref:Hydroxymethylglutaryl-CoA lyase n=1 Tax=Anaerosphaera aminiphila DSM 21120 TaxID=1120995 RepID=A0A1M5NR13_9FIRM|nr:hydroxymethylglutaryl-CoA lyase [Anaerosphaera aminiphila]SHG92016.1 hydroxymethylglutaryl-CoA lyase [Anaerosphaera aminiphila DSM 21120]
MQKVTICEVGLRDGLQNEKTILKTEDKIKLLNEITDAGYKIIEVGSFVNPKAVPQMADTDELFKRADLNPEVEYRALIANLKGVERAIACGCKKVKLNVSASRAHNLANLNMTPEESVAGFKSCVELAEENNIGISGSISMPFGSPWDSEIPIEDVKKIIEAYIDVGIREISLSDAAGVAYPSQVYNISKLVKKEYPEVKWILHFHNTRGLAIANILAGMEAGVDCFDTAFAGLGGCPFVPGAAGNISSEDVLHMLELMDIETDINLDKVIEIGKEVVSLVNHQTDSYILKAGKAKDLIKELPTKQGKNNTTK